MQLPEKVLVTTDLSGIAACDEFGFGIAEWDCCDRVGFGIAEWDCCDRVGFGIAVTS